MEQEEEFNKCPKCGNDKLVLDVVAGEEICVPCGIVVNDKVETTEVVGQRVNELAKAGRDDHHGDPVKVSTFTDGSVIAKSTQNSGMIDRLRKLDNFCKVGRSKTRTLKRCMMELDGVIPKLNLSSQVQERAAYLLRKVVDAKLIKGRTLTLFVASCIYIASREAGSYRHREEILSQMGLSGRKNEMTIYLSLISQNFNIENKRITPASLVPKIVRESGLSQRTERDAVDFLTRHSENIEFVGKDPRGLAAATIYLFSVKNNESIPHCQMTITSSAGITPVSMRKRAREILVMMRKEGVIADDPLPRDEAATTRNEGKKALFISLKEKGE